MAVETPRQRAARWLWYVNIVMAYVAVISLGVLISLSDL